MVAQSLLLHLVISGPVATQVRALAVLGVPMPPQAKLQLPLKQLPMSVSEHFSFSCCLSPLSCYCCCKKWNSFHVMMHHVCVYADVLEDGYVSDRQGEPSGLHVETMALLPIHLAALQRKTA